MFRRIFGASDSSSAPSGGGGGGGGSKVNTTLDQLTKLKETATNLQKREELLWKKVNEELEKAKEFTRQKNKRAALQALKRKKMLEAQADNIGNSVLRVLEQIDLLEASQVTAMTVQAMKQGAAQLKSNLKENNIEDVDKVMDDINEQTDNMRAVQEALGQPLAGSAYDEDDLDAELAELEALGEEEEAASLEAQMLAPAVPNRPLVMPSAPVAAKPAAPARSKEEEELAALEAEMALA
mmetsp:Transcript_38678/g.84130  ORF Transcript_38678/g.84130 Transcript_38678/m.84130 type:complete len:239 (-) Transcript_38678:543-1259(-)